MRACYIYAYFSIVLAKGFIEDLGDTVIESSLNRVFMHLRHPVCISQSMIFNENVVNTAHLIFRYLIFLSVISFTNKLLILL